MNDILTVAADSAKQAGCFLLDNFGKIKEIESKGDRSLATNLDKEAEAMIVDRIRSNFPDHGIIGEEGGSDGVGKDYLWIIDPLDGTHNFIRNINIFGVSIGVVHKDEFIAGAIYMPGDDELYTAEQGNGAYKNGKKISVSCQEDLKDCSISFDSSIRYSPEPMLKALDSLSREVFNVRMFGSSARHLSYLAEGNLDACVEFHDKPWDFAGGVCIIKEAGGVITDLKGAPLTYKTTGYITSNPAVYDKIKQLIAPYLD